MINREIDNMTLEQLENDYWTSPSSFPTSLVENVFLLRKRAIGDLDSNDIRILLSQNVGLKYLVPRAIDLLKNNIYEEALYYPGDFLLTLLNIDNKYWGENNLQKNEFVNLLEKSRLDIINTDILDDEVKEKLITSIKNFIS
jgi:hypothetical protein